MLLSGINLILKIGQQIPAPAPARLINTLQTVEIINRDDGPDGFTLTFSVGRTGIAEINHYPLVKDPLLKPFNRVIIMVTLGSKLYVLIDGAITFMEFIPSPEPGRSILKITGEDISVLMDRKEIPVEHKNLSDSAIANKIIKSYESLGVQALVSTDHVAMGAPVENDIVPFQQSTDRRHLIHLAKKYNFVFYIEPSNPPGTSIAHWGPLNLNTLPNQNPLIFNMVHKTNVTKPLNFQHSALMPTLIQGSVQDRLTNEIQNITSDQDINKNKVENIVKQKDSWEGDSFQKYPKVKQFRSRGGLTIPESYIQADAEVDKSLYSVTTSGELDTIRYGDILRARTFVEVRGCGFDHDGLYYLKKVTHFIKKGDYKQNFELIRKP